VRMTRATIVVFGASAAVLVLEIIAGRLMAPYVGISLETFTGIIGTVLAGIAVGAAVGGVLADRRDPRMLIGPALILGGALSWLSMPIVTGLGPHVDNGPVAIVILTGAAFFLPVAVLSAVSPMVAKLRLATLKETGTVVGGLSAAGTVGALAGTFLTGFVLVAAVPSKTIVIIVGAVLVAAGIVVTGLLRRLPPALAVVMLAFAVGWTGLNVASATSPCEHETAYYCVRVEVAANPEARNLYLDRLRHAYVNLEDPTDLDVGYVKVFADIAKAMPPGPLDALHIGGGGFSFPRYLEAVRPGTKNRVLEIDGELVEINKRELGLVESKDLQVDIGDARLELGRLPADSYDLVVGDAFAGESVPWHLTTTEVVREIDRLLRPGGIVMMNVIDGDKSRFARAELATLAATFKHVEVVLPPGGVPKDSPVNQVLIASQEPLPTFAIEPLNGDLVKGEAVTRYIDGARKLTDDFAPVDQLVMSI
jgi:predicted O-methyltransferase YrrM